MIDYIIYSPDLNNSNPFVFQAPRPRELTEAEIIERQQYLYRAVKKRYGYEAARAFDFGDDIGDVDIRINWDEEHLRKQISERVVELMLDNDFSVDWDLTTNDLECIFFEKLDENGEVVDDGCYDIDACLTEALENADELNMVSELTIDGERCTFELGTTELEYQK